VNATGRITMTSDSYAYVAMAESAREGHGFLDHGHRTRFPVGFPAILCALMWLGAWTHPAILAVNLLATIGGILLSLSTLARRDVPARALWVIAFLVLVSSPVLFSAGHLLSDSVFFLGTAATIELLDRSWDASGRRRAALLASACAVIAATTLVRTAGATLAPPLILTIVAASTAKGGKRRAAVLAGALLVGFALTLWLDAYVLRTHYIGEAIAWARKGIERSRLPRWAWMKVAVLGQDVLNIESWRVSRIAWIFPWVGVAALVTVALLALRRDLMRPAESFLISYLGMLFFYPAYAHRYWLPVFPIALGLVALLVARSGTAVRVLATVYVVIFSFLGMEVLFRRSLRVLRSPVPLAERLAERPPSKR
jgi:hypothetical protein